ncbi:MAG: Hsp70 family protein, partial [Pseudonocardia sp.]|nr:Hsp70 family protein [Pseudonocardia sp.]
MASGYLLGIDVGTTRTAAATCRLGAWPADTEIVNLGDRSSAVPSVLFVGDDGSVVVGEAAERRATSDPGHVVREFKRQIGDPTPVLVSGRPWAPEELAARLVQWVLDRVAQREGGPASRMAVTHPASWGAHQKDLLGAALHRYGLPVTFLAGPQAAALHYAATERVEPGSTIAVYDFGGGTFDAAVVHKDQHGFSLLGRPEGVDRLGGIDLDELVFEHVVEGLPDAFEGLDESDPAVLSAVAAVRRECTEAKEALSADTEVSIPVLTPVAQGSVRLHRSEFDAMIRPHVEETVSALCRAIASAGVGAEQLTAVLLVGGSSRIPLVTQMVSDQLGRPVAVDADPKNAIAKGAALSLTAAGISATGGYPPVPRGHGSGPVPVAPPGPATGPQPPWQTSPPQQAATAATALTASEAFAPTQRMSSPRPAGPPLPPDRPPVPEFEPAEAEYSYAPPHERRNSPVALVGVGGAVAAVAVLAGVFLWPRAAVSTTSLATTPIVEVTTSAAAPTTEAAPTTTEAPVVAPRPRPRPLPPPVVRTTEIPLPTTTTLPPTTTKPPPTTTPPPT